MKSNQNLILIAQITNAHGIKGQVKLRSFTEQPEAIFKYAPVTDETGERIFKFKKSGVDKDNFIAQIEGVETRNDAEKLRGTNLYITRDALPPLNKGYYHSDLIGLDVFDLSGDKIGIVKIIHNFGTGDILEIEDESKKSFMLLFNESSVKQVDLTERKIVIDRPEEM